MNSSSEVRPFLMHFVEKLPMLPVGGQYDEGKQLRVLDGAVALPLIASSLGEENPQTPLKQTTYTTMSTDKRDGDSDNDVESGA
jgi:hypothetical protein